MSWSASTTDPIEKQQIGSQIPTPLFGELSAAESNDQIVAARRAAEILAEACGLPADRVSIRFDGHANPGHAPTSGWANEFIQVRIEARP